MKRVTTADTTITDGKATTFSTTTVVLSLLIILYYSLFK